ncbi:MAG TPA: AMP-binding protein [Ilumatobacteraceae bacterium]|nr:AMP-binding protein [Ilumatobacteraceae bacterium]
MSQVLDALRPVADATRVVGQGVEFNIADVAVDRHVRAGHGDDPALRWIGRDRSDLDDPLDFTYGSLAARSARFAGALRQHGVAPGVAVATLLGDVPDLYIAALGTWKARCVFTPLLPSLGAEPIAERLLLGRVAVLVTTPTLFRRAVAPILNQLPELQLVLVCGASEDQSARTAVGARTQVISSGAFLRESSGDFAAEATDPDETATLCFTTETAGGPRAVLRTHRDVETGEQAVRIALDLHRSDTYWGTTHRVTDIVGAMAAGATSIVDEADFDAARWRHILAHQHVDVLHTSPAALRLLQQDSADSDAEMFALRTVAVVAPPEPATVAWAQSFLGAPVLAAWSSTGAPGADESAWTPR